MIEIAKIRLSVDRLAEPLLMPAIDYSLARQAMERLAHRCRACRKPLGKVERIEARTRWVGATYDPRLQVEIDPLHSRTRVHTGRPLPLPICADT